MSCYKLKVNSILKKEFCDKDVLMLHSCFSILEDYVEKEKALEFIAWDADSLHSIVGKDIKYLYNWWQERKKILYPIDLMDNRDQEQLQRLINIRQYLWI